LEVGITYNRMLCNDSTGPARFRLNMPEVALELKRVWHPWSKVFPVHGVVRRKGKAGEQLGDDQL